MKVLESVQGQIERALPQSSYKYMVHSWWSGQRVTVTGTSLTYIDSIG